MLVIRRRAGESLLIGPDVEVRVLETSPSRVTFGIIAPEEILVLRTEIRDANRAAARGVTPDSIRDIVARFRAPGAG